MWTECPCGKYNIVNAGAWYQNPNDNNVWTRRS